MSAEPSNEPTVPAPPDAVAAENVAGTPAANGEASSAVSGLGVTPPPSAGPGRSSLIDHIVEAVVPGTREQRWSTKTKALMGALLAMLLLGAAGCVGNLTSPVQRAN
ncbi:hypothetical protein GCM10011608_49520 [Micromonospora sonchi]|uniref:Uncharacterized protein n=1 Tax=Micromonospora sonchi TaxID=1763543 RepID=A0A917X3D1_9ACTN|nr:hypothetical protein [Micromonospora sonchi]GGM58618.1 hypothetical protein GCM10011608_49520 [Micromonospora sonchi]